MPCDGELFEVQCMVSRTPDDEYDFLTLNHYEEKISYNDDGNTQQKSFCCVLLSAQDNAYVASYSLVCSIDIVVVRSLI